jgi:hypothetical protein
MLGTYHEYWAVGKGRDVPNVGVADRDAVKIGERKFIYSPNKFCCPHPHRHNLNQQS